MDKKQYDEIKRQIIYHNELYYKKNKPEISDFEYDKLFKQLKDIESNYPQWITADSPTQSPGNDKNNRFAKHKHLVPMLSIRNTYNEDEVNDFCKKVEKEIGCFPEYTVEMKLDGAAVSLIYENDKIVVASTRGDGIDGDDITENIKEVKFVPKTPNFSKFGISKIELRGEVVISYESLACINLLRERSGKQIYANTRNLASGSLKVKDPNEIKDRCLIFILHSFGKIEWSSNSKKIIKQSDLMEMCRVLGFSLVPFRIANSISEINNIIKENNIERHEFSFATDGMVIKINNLEYRDVLGSTGHSPKWVIAYKYPSEAKETILRDIVYQVGRTGVITPKALFDPVQLAGTTVSQATLHNEDFIFTRDLRIGDTIIVEKGGEIIPKVVMVSKHGDGKKFKFIKKCPECSTDLINDDMVAWKCPNPNCKAQLIRRLQHFVSRQCLDIDSLGNEKIEQFVELGLISSFEDIFKLSEKKLSNVERLGDKSISKILKSIEKAKECDPSRLLYGLGISLVGKSVSPLLLEKVDKIQQVFELSQKQINEIEGFGNAVFESLQDSKKSSIKILNELEKLGVNVIVKKKKNKSNKLNDLKFVVTGSFSNRSRKELEEYIVANGGKLSGSVSKNTDYLVAGTGTEGGSKITKANKFEVKILDEIKFEEKFINK